MRLTVGANQQKTFVLPFEDVSDVEVVLDGEGAEALVLGYFVGRDTDVFEVGLTVLHQSPRTKARTLVKGILTDQSTCHFTGLIKIEEQAQRSNSYLADHTLLLSEDAHVESIPSLEIEANDVKASHGATIGRIDENQLYYLQTRGLDENTAQKLMIEGFFRPVIEKMEHESEKRRLLGKIKNV